MTEAEVRREGSEKTMRRLWHGQICSVSYSDGGFMHVYISKLIKVYALNICCLLHVNYTLIQQFKRLALSVLTIPELKLVCDLN